MTDSVMEDTCLLCKGSFTPDDKGFNRHRVISSRSPKTASQQTQPDQYICRSCFKLATYSQTHRASCDNAKRPAKRPADNSATESDVPGGKHDSGESTATPAKRPFRIQAPPQQNSSNIGIQRPGKYKEIIPLIQKSSNTGIHTLSIMLSSTTRPAMHPDGIQTLSHHKSSETGIQKSGIMPSSTTPPAKRPVIRIKMPPNQKSSEPGIPKPSVMLSSTTTPAKHPDGIQTPSHHKSSGTGIQKSGIMPLSNTVPAKRPDKIQTPPHQKFSKTGISKPSIMLSSTTTPTNRPDRIQTPSHQKSSETGIPKPSVMLSSIIETPPHQITSDTGIRNPSVVLLSNIVPARHLVRDKVPLHHDQNSSDTIFQKPGIMPLSTTPPSKRPDKIQTLSHHKSSETGIQESGIMPLSTTLPAKRPVISIQTPPHQKSSEAGIPKPSVMLSSTTPLSKHPDGIQTPSHQKSSETGIQKPGIMPLSTTLSAKRPVIRIETRPPHQKSSEPGIPKPSVMLSSSNLPAKHPDKIQTPSNHKSSETGIPKPSVMLSSSNLPAKHPDKIQTPLNHKSSETGIPKPSVMLSSTTRPAKHPYRIQTPSHQKSSDAGLQMPGVMLSSTITPPANQPVYIIQTPPHHKSSDTGIQMPGVMLLSTTPPANHPVRLQIPPRQNSSDSGIQKPDVPGGKHDQNVSSTLAAMHPVQYLFVQPASNTGILKPGTPAPVERAVTHMPMERAVTHMPMERAVTHMPVERAVTHMPAERAVTHMPEERAVTHMPVERAVTHMPVERAVTHMPVERAVTHMPVERAVTHMPVERAVTHMPVEKAVTHMPVERAVTHMPSTSSGQSLTGQCDALNRAQKPLPETKLCAKSKKANCVYCKHNFIQKKKVYYKVSNVSTPRTFAAAFGSMVYDPDGYICISCYKLICLETFIKATDDWEKKLRILDDLAETADDKSAKESDVPDSERDRGESATPPARHPLKIRTPPCSSDTGIQTPGTSESAPAERVTTPTPSRSTNGSVANQIDALIQALKTLQDPEPSSSSADDAADANDANDDRRDNDVDANDDRRDNDVDANDDRRNNDVGDTDNHDLPFQFQPFTPKESAISYIKESKYRLAFQKLCRNSPKAKREFLELAFEMIKKEVKTMKRDEEYLINSRFCQPVTKENVKDFRWKDLIKEAKKVMPVAVGCISAMMPTISGVKAGRSRGGKDAKRPPTDNEAKEFIDRQLGQMLAISLFTNRPKKFNFVQGCMGVELWRKGVPKRVFKTLNHNGFTMCAEIVKPLVDSLAEIPEQELKEWKETTEKCPTPIRTNRQKRGYTGGPPTFGFSVDKALKNFLVGRTTKVSKQTTCVAAKDRVSRPLTVPSTSPADAENLDPFSFLPSPKAFDRQRERMVQVVANIMGRHMAFLEHLSSRLPKTKEHRLSAVMAQPSEMLTIGVEDANPRSAEGIVKVLETLQKYIPVSEATPTQTLVSGEGLMSKWILKSQMERADGERWEDRLDAFYPTPQEFKKEILLLQELNNVFFRSESVSAHGTIAQLKSDFHHDWFKKKVIYNVQHTRDMYEFATEGYTLLCALKICETSSLDEVPRGFPSQGSTKKQLKWVKAVARQVVDFVYEAPEKSSIEIAAEAFRAATAGPTDTDTDSDSEEEEEAAGGKDPFGFCHCNSEKDEEMVRCGSAACHKSWFHLSCVRLKSAPDPDADWFCGWKCRKDPSSIYCVCKRKEDPRGRGTMVQCALKGDCKGHEWYHHRCIGLQLTDVLPERWYCSEACALDSENDDHVLNHSRALTLHGLRHLARKAAVQVGNGPVMVEDWKIDLLTFWTRNHPAYLQDAHYFLACVGGCAPERIRTSLIWNRVVNVTGKPDGNVGIDEHKDLDFRGMGCGKIMGLFTQYLHRMLSNPTTFSRKITHRKTEDEYKQDITTLVNDGASAGLFDYMPVREHTGFEGFEAREVLQNPRRLGQKLKALCRRMDSQRRQHEDAHREIETQLPT